MADSSIKFDMSNLEDLIKLLKDDYTLRVGIIGAKAKTKHAGKNGKSDLTNADLGTIHEFGSQKVENHPPRRSFLEDSLKFKLNFNTEEIKKMRNVLFTQFFVKKAPEKFLQDLGAKCLQIIEEGFATNGFGMWKPLTESAEEAIGRKHKRLTMNQAKGKSIATYRKSLKFWSARNILTETGKLRRSISFKVFKNGR